ncbi:hypothetical protein CVS37_25800 [Burkholderia lata]|nr:hypothetical protein CVS37_25800 [Burkholderia lata]
MPPAVPKLFRRIAGSARSHPGNPPANPRKTRAKFSIDAPRGSLLPSHSFSFMEASVPTDASCSWSCTNLTAA